MRWLVLLVLLASCQVADDPVIGASLTLTGDLAFIHQEFLNGMQMAIDELQENGTRIGFVIDDNEGDATRAVGSVRKLIDADGADVVITGYTHIAIAIAPIAAERGTLLLYASTVEEIAEGSSLAFRDYFDASESGEAIMDAVEREGHREVALLTEVSEVCDSFESGVRKGSYERRIGIVAYEQYQSPDFRTQLLKIGKSQPDALVTCTWKHTPQLMRQLAELGMLGMQTFQAVAPYFPASGEDEVERLFEENRAVSTWYGASDPQDPSYKDFVRRYQQRYGSAPRPDALYGYDDIMVLAQGMESCGEDARCLSDFLLAVEYDGVAGALSFDESGVSERPVPLLMFRAGEWRAYG